MNKKIQLIKFVANELIKRLEDMQKRSISIASYLCSDRLIVEIFKTEAKRESFFENERIAIQWTKAHLDKNSKYNKSLEYHFKKTTVGSFVLSVIIGAAFELLWNCKTFRNGVLPISEVTDFSFHDHPYNIIKELKENLKKLKEAA